MRPSIDVQFDSYGDKASFAPEWAVRKSKKIMNNVVRI
jgi:hypothetical protein